MIWQEGALWARDLEKFPDAEVRAEGVRLYPSDLRAIALALLDDDPTISLAGARRVVIYCQEYTETLLDDSRVWGDVERLAKVLYRRRYLSPRAIKKVLGDAFFIGVQRSRGVSSDY